MHAVETFDIKPQPGPQEAFLGTPADIGIMGGAAGGGKTWSLLMEPIRHQAVKGFGAVIFRRTFPEITNKGGLWEESQKLYTYLDAAPKESILEWAFESNATVKFSHLQLEKDVLAWRGAQIPMIGFDQIEGFTEHQFWYMVSRNRSMCGVKPYLRATCNPVTADDAIGGWLNRFVSWWINQETGYPIPERAGRLRWMIRSGDDLIWANTKAELLSRFPEQRPLSVTFVPATLEDNPALMQADPDYKGKLMALPTVERERLLGGNWNVRAAAGKVFNREQFDILYALPVSDLPDIRYWDKAGTEDGGCRTAGVRLRRAGPLFIVVDVVLGQWGALERERVIHQTAQMDGPDVKIRLEQEPGSGGKESAEATIRMLIGYDIAAKTVTGDKVQRANPFAAQCQARNVKLYRGDWNKAYLDELHAFPESKYKDQVDASSGAFNELAPIGGFELRCNGRSTQEHYVAPAVEQLITQQGIYWPRQPMGSR